jgi:hypothetical protein
MTTQKETDPLSAGRAASLATTGQFACNHEEGFDAARGLGVDTVNGRTGHGSSTGCL